MKFNLANAYPILCLFISLGAYSQSKNDSVTLTGKLVNFTIEIQVDHRKPAWKYNFHVSTSYCFHQPVAASFIKTIIS
jgi:hypothetical protein